MVKSHEQQLQSEKHNTAENKQDTCLELPGLSDEILQELLRYIYTDHVDNLDTIASTLLPVGENYHMPGLKLLCERTLIETITPERVASLLLLADQFGCDSLKRATLAYCEDNATSIKKSLAWKVMEIVNPDLFMEACEAGLGSSISSNLDSIPSDTELGLWSRADGSVDLRSFWCTKELKFQTFQQQDNVHKFQVPVTKILQCHAKL